MFSDFQRMVNEGWRQRRQPVDPVRQRKQQLCPKCGKDGFRVKMDYLGNKHVQMVATKYDVSFFRCPRCRFMDKEIWRIPGRGRTGLNMGQLYGGA